MELCRLQEGMGLKHTAASETAFRRTGRGGFIAKDCIAVAGRLPAGIRAPGSGASVWAMPPERDGRVVVKVVQFLQHHRIVKNGLWVKALLPALFTTGYLARTLLLQQARQPLPPFRWGSTRSSFG